MKNTDYYDRMAKNLYERSYSDGYSDGLHKGIEEHEPHSKILEWLKQPVDERNAGNMGHRLRESDCWRMRIFTNKKRKDHIFL